MLYLFVNLNLYTTFLSLLALTFVLFYEVINGFHDAANAVATVIYTRAMQPQLAVIIAAISNFFGVLLGGLNVASTILHMLPVNLLLNTDFNYNLAMVFSLLLSAIIWNLSTWYIGLPSSSSHTLIGAIIGIGLTNALLTGSSVIDALNFSKVLSILISLIVSPLIGLVIAGGLTFILYHYWNNNKKHSRFHLTPYEREKKDGKKKPPFWIRVMLILSTITMSLSHGANDGQKGIGLMMLVLISIAPAGFMINMHASNYEITRTKDAINNLKIYFQQNPILLEKTIELKQSILSSKINDVAMNNMSYSLSENIINTLKHVKEILNNIKKYNELTIEQRSQIRHIVLYISDIIDKVVRIPELNNSDKKLLKELKEDILNTIEYAPTWIIMMIALALGIGTMVGWRRLVITISEKIGKKSMTYAQSMSAQITAAISIGLASYTGMPVSTTHVLSSSVAGTMIVNGGGLQHKTVISILVAWIFTFPVTITLSSGLYWVMLKLL